MGSIWTRANENFHPRVGLHRERVVKHLRFLQAYIFVINPQLDSVCLIQRGRNHTARRRLGDLRYYLVKLWAARPAWLRNISSMPACGYTKLPPRR